MLTRMLTVLAVSIAGWVLLAQQEQETLTAPKANDVKQLDDAGFSLEMEIPVKAKASVVYHAFTTEIDQWWNGAHTFSTNAGNLSFDVEKGGGLYESMPGGGFVRHLQLVTLIPNRIIRLEGGLGPLQEYGVHGAMTIVFAPNETGCSIKLKYNVGGNLPGGAKAFQQWAPPVAKVIREQMERLQAHCEG